MAKSPYIHPNHRSAGFMGGVRQKWCAIFTIIGLVTLGLTAFNLLRDPSPFLTFFLSVGVTFILGASASDCMKAWCVNSSTSTNYEEMNETINETNNQKIDETHTDAIIRPRNYDDASIP